MYLAIANFLLVVYVIGLVAIHTVTFFFHLLIILAVVSLVMHLVRGRG